MTQNIDALIDRVESMAVAAVYDPSLIETYKELRDQIRSIEHAGWQRRNGTLTQEATVLNHLEKAGSITVREAMVEYSIQSLTKRISNLREMGHDIVSNRKSHPITKQKYVRYSLA